MPSDGQAEKCGNSVCTLMLDGGHESGKIPAIEFDSDGIVEEEEAKSLSHLTDFGVRSLLSI